MIGLKTRHADCRKFLFRFWSDTESQLQTVCRFSYNVLVYASVVQTQVCKRNTNKLRAKKGPAPQLGNFADISYLKENFKPHLLR